MAFTPIIVTATYANADGSAPTGTVTFTPTAVMEQTGEIVAIAPIPATLSSTGTISVTLLANDDREIYCSHPVRTICRALCDINSRDKIFISSEYHHKN